MGYNRIGARVACDFLMRRRDYIFPLLERRMEIQLIVATCSNHFSVSFSPSHIFVD